MSDSGWKFVDSYDVSVYRCGLRAGRRIALRRELVIHDHRGKPTGVGHPVGETYMVLQGCEADPGVVWLSQADGERCIWDDGAEIFDWFEVVGLPDAY